MAPRIGMSQVKFKVRHNALLLREFTVADMIRATGLNPESVRTELQRMKQEGLLASRPYPDKPKKRGGRPAIYHLTDDPEARLALSQSIEAFYPPPPPADRPTSRHYQSARQLLDGAQTVDDRQRERLLADAEHDLEIAEQAEGGSLAPERVKAYLQYERARLAYLRDEYEEAERSFEALREFFVDAHDEAMVRRINEFRLCLNAWKRFAARMPDTVSEITWARCLLDTLAENNYQTDSPLIQRLLLLVHQLSRTADEKVRAVAFDLAVEVSRREVEAIEALRIEQERLSYETAMLRQGEWRPLPAWSQREEPRPLLRDDWPFRGMVGHQPPRRSRQHTND